jgi:hypothetical protein
MVYAHELPKTPLATIALDRTAQFLSRNHAKTCAIRCSPTIQKGE